MSGRDMKMDDPSKKKRYLFTRLNSHGSGRLSGDQFCVYIANRIVIPRLTANQLARFETGELTLDTLTKQYIRSKLEYQYATVATSAEAYELERQCRSGQFFGCKPLLNPYEPAATATRRKARARKPKAKGGDAQLSDLTDSHADECGS